MDARRALKLQVEWGADEALEALPQRRLRVPPPPGRSVGAPAADARTAAAVATSTTAVLRPLPADLAQLAAALAASDGGGLAATATHLVLPVGTPFGAAGGLLVVGEAPGAEEDRSGHAFVGPEGQLLRRMLASIGVDPAAAMLAYLSPWRPPGGRPLSEAEIAACLPFLHQLIVVSRPSLLLALGSVPAKALLGPAMRRGRWGEAAIPVMSGSISVLPTANPAVLRRQPQQKAAAWADLRWLRRRMDSK